MGLPEPLGPPEVGEPDVMLPLGDREPLPEVGEVELGTPILDAVDGVPLRFDGALLGFVDDCVDGLATLEPGVLAADDVCEGWESTELPEGAEGEVPLDDPTSLDTVGEVELGIPILEAVDGALLGFADDCADGLATLEPGALPADDVCEDCESTELPEGAEGDVALDEPTPLDTGLEEPTATELAFWLDAGEPGLLPTCDDNPEPLPGLAELICDGCDGWDGWDGWDGLDAALGEGPELPDCKSLLPPLADGTELVADDSLGLVLLARLDRDDASLGAEELPMELAPLEGFPELGCVDSPELVVDGGDDGVLDAPELESIELVDDGVCDDGWLSRLEA